MTVLGYWQRPPANVSHRPRGQVVAWDPTGGAWWQDCLCGWKCPLFLNEDDAAAAHRAHVVEAMREGVA